MIKVLIIDDSRVVREYLTHILETDSGIQVIGVVEDGSEALSAVRTLKPDVVTMDIHMKSVDGFIATKQIMEAYPVPIIIVTNSFGNSDDINAFKAVEAGAVSILKKPAGFSGTLLGFEARQLIDYVKIMSEVKVVRRRAVHAAATKVSKRDLKEYRILAIGSSTGGPAVIQQLLAELPKNLPVPVVIVQHIAVGFIKNFHDWLINTTIDGVQIAAQGELLLPGRVYLCPDDSHMTVLKDNTVFLEKFAAKDGQCASVSRLFKSVDTAFGDKVFAVLLTGMGRDGALELKGLRDHGALTVAQSKESCVVFGMPGEAVKLKGAEYVLDPEDISALIAKVLAHE